MSKQTVSRFSSHAGWVAWSLCALSVVLALMTAWLFALSYDADAGSGWSSRGALLFFFIYSIVGALIVSRQPRHLIGWVFCWTGLANEVMGFSKEYAIYSLLTQPGLLPGGEIMGWLRSWLWMPGTMAAITFVPLLFPTGHLPSRRWRPVVWITAIAMAAATLAFALIPGRLSETPFIVNPFGIDGAGDILQLIGVAGLLISGTMGLSGIVSLLQRMRHATGQERKQYQWLGLVLLLYGIAAPLVFIAPAVAPIILVGVAQAIPIAVGIAILRYRLYDIDIIIRRTLVYSALTASLAFVYFGSVVLLQQLFRALTGQQQSEIVTVVSTLALAALFIPLRHRIQDTIDRRFFRRKYDAAKVLAQFAATARDEVELDKLTERLLDVVDETMQPASVSLWLRSTTDVKREK